MRTKVEKLRAALALLEEVNPDDQVTDQVREWLRTVEERCAGPVCARAGS